MISHRSLIGAASLLLLSGCATSSTPLRTDATTRLAENTPSYFLVGSHDSDVTTEPAPGEGCRNPMVDPRNGTRLILVRALEGLGDYDVPTGQYGVGKKELLRLECKTGRSTGIARR